VSWLHAPVYLLRELSAQLPRLAAAESLRRTAEIAAGTGSLKPDAQRRILGDWQRLAARDRRETVARGRGPAEFEAAMATLGVPIEKVKVARG
jgi:hypothetical protein